MQLLRQIQMLDLIGELEQGLMEENVFWNTNKSSLNKEKKKKRERGSQSQIQSHKAKMKQKRNRKNEK